MSESSASKLRSDVSKTFVNEKQKAYLEREIATTGREIEKHKFSVDVLTKRLVGLIEMLSETKRNLQSL